MGLVFYLISAVAAAGALAAVLLKNLVHCALALTVLGLALLFLRLDAQFAGFAQILVYVGAVAILVVFAVTGERAGPSEGRRVLKNVAGGACDCVCGVCSSGLGGVAGWAVASCSVPPQVTVNQIGQALMGRYVCRLEIVAAGAADRGAAGAVIVAMHEKEGTK